MTIDNLIEIGELAAMDDPSVLQGIEVLVGSNGDLDKDEDGVCQSLSASLTFGAVSGYLFDETEITMTRCPIYVFLALILPSGATTRQNPPENPSPTPARRMHRYPAMP